MEIERMRRILAERCMGWHKMEMELELGARAIYWVDASGEARASVSRWKPDQKWQDCLLTIEEMRKAGWKDDLAWLPDGTFRVRFNRGDAWGESCNVVDGELSEPHARMLAAARALESENTDGH